MARMTDKSYAGQSSTTNTSRRNGWKAILGNHLLLLNASGSETRYVLISREILPFFIYFHGTQSPQLAIFTGMETHVHQRYPLYA